MEIGARTFVVALKSSELEVLGSWFSPYRSGYWNDKDVLQKLGEAMGLAVAGEPATSAENAGPDEIEEPGIEDESIVHHTASVGDVEESRFRRERNAILAKMGS
ncbi:hypothetical protein HYC85_017319 [Camellia sinensis]|uniref:Uncharacterized protein n=1 Tax=Camellia sinensis TaxID=4442 RepID=A0A7J7H4E3_CAMSI|nr:hypothetical protein HYC85_017319 [Camellia sinensis]